ncbi:hypothetical protein FIV49_06095 [Cylindrospermopsis raciborskii GIHE 2018]|nr:hypothetical protein FIV49_06095 [Cylindrospermopsis raciborskii GIHE 2018]
MFPTTLLRDVHQGAKTPEIVYPESDGQPMADNTRQFTWIVKVNRPTHKGMGFCARSINYYLHDSLPLGVLSWVQFFTR